MPFLSSKSAALRLFLALFVLLMFTRCSWAGSSTVVISQVYGGGGSASALYNADYVELFNISATPQSLNGLSVQYISASGTTAALVISLPNVTLAPGQRFLIEGPGTCTATGCVTLPTADLTSTLAASGTAGKVYLSSSTTAIALTGGSCAAANVLDFVGYGATASCFEGAGPSPATTISLVAIRTNACTDTDNNAADFTAVATTATTPRNSTSTPTPCTGGSSTLAMTARANPASVFQGSSTLLTAAVSPATTPASTGVAVAADLSAFGGSTTQPLYDDGTNGDVTAGDNIYSYSLSVSNAASLGAATIVTSAVDAQLRMATSNISLVVLAPLALVPIHTIQGGTPGTAAYAGQNVMASGIVTGIRNNGFFLQARDTDIDSNPATPEGIFVHTATGNVPAAATIGTEIQVTGLVALYPPAGPLPGTELDNPSSFTVLSTSNALPAPIMLTMTNPSPAGGFAQLQRYQSMRVAVPSFTVTGPTGGALSEVNEIYTSTGQFWGTVTGIPRPVREPGLEILDPLTASQPATIPRFDDNPELFQVDSIALTPTPGPLDIATGTLLTGLSGVLDFSGGKAALDIDATARPVVSGGMTVVPVPAANAGEVTIGDQNFERFYNTVKGDTFGHNGDVAVTAAAYALRLSKASLAVRNVLRNPDILAVEEMESLANLNDLGAKISADAVAAGQTDPHYAAYLQDGNDVGVINVGFLVNPAKVNVVSVIQYGKATTTTGTSTILNDRPPLVLHAGIKRAGAPDYPITVIVNHLRSLNGVTDPTTTGINVRTKREQQAEFLANLTQGFQAAGEHVVVVGDLNTFEFNDGLVDSFGILKGSAAPANQDVLPGTTGLVTPNLVDAAPTDLTKGAYSYSFNGNAQTLDHFLVTADIAGITRTAPAHYDADFPAVLRNDPTRPEVASDHDGIVGYIAVPASAVSLAITPAAPFVGGNVTLTATVTGNSVTPTGTVDFLDGATVLKSGATISAGVATFSTTTLGAGAHTLTAIYSGDAVYPAATSAVSAITVVVPDFTLTVGSAQLTASSSMPAPTTAVNVGMINGFSSAVSFTCAGLPANSRCVFAPATLSASGSTTLTVQINTLLGDMHSPFDRIRGTEGVLACGLLALPFVLRRRVPVAARLLSLALLFGGLAGIVGCSGGTSGPVTPKGSTLVVVTATGAGVTHSASFTLVVQ